MKEYAKILGKENKIVKVNDSYFNAASNKPKYLGLKSLKKNTNNYSINDCIKHHLNKTLSKKI